VSPDRDDWRAAVPTGINVPVWLVNYLLSGVGIMKLFILQLPSSFYCAISGYRCGINKIVTLLECYTALIDVYRRSGTACRPHIPVSSIHSDYSYEKESCEDGTNRLSRKLSN